MKKALSLFLALVMCLSLCACGSESQDENFNNEKNVQDKLETNVREKASIECIAAYKGGIKSLDVSVTDYDDNGDGTYDVKGYVKFTDDYGDHYKAKYNAVVTIADHGYRACKEFNMDTPREDK